jgi:hypothetical protein
MKAGRLEKKGTGTALRPLRKVHEIHEIAACPKATSFAILRARPFGRSGQAGQTNFID